MDRQIDSHGDFRALFESQPFNRSFFFSTGRAIPNGLSVMAIFTVIASASLFITIYEEIWH